MELNQFFHNLDLIIQFLNAVVLFIILLMSAMKLKRLFFAKVSTDQINSENAEVSYFLTALVVAVGHFVGSSISEYILNMELEKMQKRQFFYFMMFFIEVVFVITLILLHKLRRCNFSRIAFYVCILSIIMAILQMEEFVMRGIYDKEYLGLLYRYSVVLINLCALALISAYPLFVLLNENLGKKIKQVDSTAINSNNNQNVTYEDSTYEDCTFTSKKLYNLAIDRVSVDAGNDLKTAIKEYRRIDEDLLQIGKQLKKPASADTIHSE